jgi:uncharacterized membrane protein YfhO
MLMAIAWPGFLAACVLQVVVFALVDPLDLHWAGEHLPWSRQAVYAFGFLLFWIAAMLSSALTTLLGRRSEDLNRAG